MTTGTPNEFYPIRDDFAAMQKLQTRLADNDMNGHLNNAVYYQLFDSAINAPLIAEFGGSTQIAETARVVAESGCRFLAEVRYPDLVEVGVRITKLGRSSVAYQCALFSTSNQVRSEIDTGGGKLLAVGHWVHVFIDPKTRKSKEIPPKIRSFLETLYRQRVG